MTSDSSSSSASESGSPGKKSEVSSSKLFSDDSSSESDNDLGKNRKSQASARQTNNDKSSENDENKKESDDVEMSQLFGSDLDSDEEQEFKSSEVKREERDVQELASSQPVGSPSLPPVSLVLPDAPRIPKGSKIIYAKMPNMIRVKSECYNPELEEESSSKVKDDGEDDEVRSDDENVKATKEETKDIWHYIRWRYIRDEQGKIAVDANGLPMRESNTKMVRWSDGSVQLIIGTQAFTVSERTIHNTYAFVQHEKMGDAGESCLECQGAIQQKLTFRPAQGATHGRRGHGLASRSRGQSKGSKIMEYISGSDPDVDKRSRAKMNDDQLRIKAKKKNKEEYENDRVRASSRMDVNFLEGAYDDDDDGNLASIKNKFRTRGRDVPSGRTTRSSSGVASFDEYERGLQDDDGESRLMRAKRRTSEAKMTEEMSDDEEAEMVSRLPKKRRTMVDDDDEDED